jgi:hypothetical protein
MRHTTTRVRAGATALVMLFPSLVLAVPLLAQEQASDTMPATTPYLSPSLALAAPARGESLPQDKPSIVLRYARGEPDDPRQATSTSGTDTTTRAPGGSTRRIRLAWQVD